eukprot:CAMPEP_0170099394 /NCGR_PEP_ID=MMETSP0020_2-20130122/1007_1 /TAXON_ID=98059 /ORGANISM="Dinobryon sp., Strain UTEXLB2267" /LENGTH=448 /DNA_ID=CAMNT_0010322031 /DNA_START=462 /DNA_END=1808 /DNA_ORIENTATION=+
MDCGVGFFIISSAITSKYARSVYSEISLTSSEQSGAIPLSTSGRKRFLSHIFSPHRFAPITVNSLVVLALGVGRMVVTKLLHYQEHVSEYGVHWNFFVTLSCVWMITDCIHRCFPPRLTVAIAIIILIIYQWLLSCTTLTNYILSAPRSNIFAANKEGIVSLVGYVPMFLLAEWLSSIILFNHTHKNLMNQSNRGVSKGAMINSSHYIHDEIIDNEAALSESSGRTTTSDSSEPLLSSPLTEPTVNSNTNDINSSIHIPTIVDERFQNIHQINSSSNSINGVDISWDFALMRKLALCAVILWMLWLIGSTIQPTSRRLANFTYVTLCLFLSMTLLLSLYIVDKLGDVALSKTHQNTDGTTPVRTVHILTLENMNKHALPVFIAANLLTGLVNRTLRTIYASTAMSLVVLTVYILHICSLSWHVEFIYRIISRLIGLLRRCRLKSGGES